MFSGNLLPGADARQARLRLTAFFRLTDPPAVEAFFLGGKVTLRRSLPRSEAQALCERLLAGGLECHVVATSEPEPEAKESMASAPPPNRFQIRSDQHGLEAGDDDVLQLRFLAAAVITGVLGLALAAAVLARLLWWSATPPVPGPQDIAAAADGTLYMLAGNRLLVHNRAGSSTAQYSARELGLRAIDGLLLVRDDRLLVSASGAGAERAVRRPWRCSLAAAEAPACTPLTDEPVAVASLAASTLTDTFFAITADNALLRIVKGRVQERMAVPYRTRSPRLINHCGLLLLNRSEGPGLGVHRPDAAAFGEQLDEILLLHPEAIARRQDRIRDFAHNIGAGWALLTDDGDGGTHLYRFDADWAPAQAITLPPTPEPRRLAAWRDRLLVYNPDSLWIGRINPEGRVEAPLVSDSLNALAASTQTRGARDQALFRLLMLILAIALGIGATLTWITHQKRLQPQRRSPVPTFVLEHRLRQLRWLAPDPARVPARQRWTLAAVGTALLLCASAIAGAATLSAIALSLFLFALSARYFLGIHAVQIGVGEGELALVDHRGVYQTGPAGDFQILGPFVFRGGVIGCIGLPGLPGLATGNSNTRLRANMQCLARCARGHPASVVELLLQTRHPLVAVALSIPVAMALLAMWQLILAVVR